MEFKRFKYLTFDCYGTLVDWEQGILGCLVSAHPDFESVAQAELLKSFAKWEAQFEAATFYRYREVLNKVQAAMCEEFEVSIADPGMLADSVGKWSPFPDSTLALRHLQQRYKLGILSNVDNDMFAQTRSQLDVNFDLICTAEDIGSYKPATENFEFLLERVDCHKSEVLHIAQSLFHDHLPARELGIETIWVNRPSVVPGQGATLAVDVRPKYEVSSMAELVQLLMPI